MAKKAASTNGATVDRTELRAALAKDAEERVQAASEEIAAVCENHKVRLDPSAVLSQGNIRMSIQILPIE